MLDVHGEAGEDLWCALSEARFRDENCGIAGGAYIAPLAMCAM